MRFPVFASLPTLAFAAFAPLMLAAATPKAAHAQANLIFSGGNGSPLSVTLTNPVVYTVTQAGGFNNAPSFVFDAVGSASLGYPSATGTITFSINGGSAQTLNIVNQGIAENDLTSDDFYTYGSVPGVSIGDIVTLTAGTLTTTPNIASAPPTSGTFTTFLTDGSGRRISSDGVAGSAAPEPSTLPIFGMGLTMGAGILSRRRKMVGTVKRRKQGKSA